MDHITHPWQASLQTPVQQYESRVRNLRRQLTEEQNTNWALRADLIEQRQRADHVNSQLDRAALEHNALLGSLEAERLMNGRLRQALCDVLRIAEAHGGDIDRHLYPTDAAVVTACKRLANNGPTFDYDPSFAELDY